MNKNKDELRQYLSGTLHELNKLTDQIRVTRDYSDQAEFILCLRVLVSEQIEVTAGTAKTL